MDFVSIGISVALFVIAMLIVIVLRLSDQRTRSFASVKKMLDKLQDDLKMYDATFKQEVVDIENKVSLEKAEAHDLIQTVAAQIVELKTYSEDLGSLHNTMSNYKNSIAALYKLTKDADDKLKEVEEDIEKIQDVRVTIDTFYAELDGFDELLEKKEKDSSDRFTAQMEKVYNRYSASIKELEEKANKTMSVITDAVHIAEVARTSLAESLETYQTKTEDVFVEPPVEEKEPESEVVESFTEEVKSFEEQEVQEPEVAVVESFEEKEVSEPEAEEVPFFEDKEENVNQEDLEKSFGLQNMDFDEISTDEEEKESSEDDSEEIIFS